MRDYFSSLALHARHQFSRHLRSPFIWVLAIAGPLVARFMVPPEGSDYTMLVVNDSVLAHSASVIGLQLGVITAVILTPLAYIFLRAGPTRHQPWQVTDVTPRARSALSLGQWLGDVGALWLLLLGLALSGFVLSFFRLPLSGVNPFATILSVAIVAGPTLAIIAAVRVLFAMRPLLRGALGDVLFFVFWMVGLVMSASMFMGGQAASPMLDMFGFASSVAYGTADPITELYIGGGPGAKGIMDFDGIAAVTHPDYLLSRAVWLAIAAVFAAIAGQAFKPRRVKPQRNYRKPISDASNFSIQAIQAVSPKMSALPARVATLISELFQPRYILVPLVIIAGAGAVLPLRGMVGPALVLVLIFPLTRYGSRWRAKTLVQWQNALPSREVADTVMRLMVASLAVLLLLLPSIATMDMAESSDVLAIAVGLPAIAIGLGYLTRSAVAGRLILLILWYGYLNLPAVVL